jgi:hypothetical protein
MRQPCSMSTPQTYVSAEAPKATAERFFSMLPTD